MEIILENLNLVLAALVGLTVVFAFIIIAKKMKQKKKLKQAAMAAGIVEDNNFDAEEDLLIEEAPEGFQADFVGLEEVYTKDAQNFITIKLKVGDKNIELLDIEPSHNKFGNIHLHSNIINKKYRAGQEFKIFFNLGLHGVSHPKYKFSFTFRYRDDSGKKWKQQFIYKRPAQGNSHLHKMLPAA